MSKRKTAQKAVYFLGILVLVLGMLYSGLRILESTVSSNRPDENNYVSKTIVRDGVEYFPRQDLEIILLMGIDELGPVVSSGSYRNTGEADAVVLLILDRSNETFRVLCLNRDTMLEMPVLGLAGGRAGTAYGQLALAHTYGEGLEDSCENTREAVSQLLYGIRIDHYVSMNMDAIGMVNDAVGGVTVTVTDDFSAVDPSIGMGVVTLRAEQALNYVRTRMDVGNQLNISRIERHKDYMQGLLTALRENVNASDSFVINLYDQVDEYMVTDCSVNTVSALISQCSDYTLAEIVSPEGENVLGDEFYEFYVDEEALDQLILRLFYAEK